MAEKTFMKRLLLLAALLLSRAGHAAEQPHGLTWNSTAIYVGKSWDPSTGARVNTYLAQIESVGPDASGYYEIWTETKPYYQESYADHEALEYRAKCNATRSNACVHSQLPAWNERLDTVIFVH
jgi:hypothetical protein